MSDSPRYPAVPPVVPRFRVLSFNEVLQLPDPEWLIEGILQANGFAVLYGPPNVGKTFVALDMALSIASAADWAGAKTIPGAVVYVIAEGVAGLGKRLKAWCRAHDVADVPGFRSISDSPQLADTKSVDQLVHSLNKQISEPISLIVIDTMARCFQGDENSSKDVGELVRGADKLIKELNCSVLLVHHTTKSGNSERGSSALAGAADTMISIEPASEELKLMKVVCAKQKQWDRFKTFNLCLKPVEGSCVVELCDESAGQEKMLRCLQVLADNPQGLTATNWKKAADLSDTTFYRYREGFDSKELIRKDAKLYFVSEKGRETLAPTTNKALAS